MSDAAGSVGTQISNAAAPYVQQALSVGKQGLRRVQRDVHLKDYLQRALDSGVRFGKQIPGYLENAGDTVRGWFRSGPSFLGGVRKDVKAIGRGTKNYFDLIDYLQGRHSRPGFIEGQLSDAAANAAAKFANPFKGR